MSNHNILVWDSDRHTCDYYKGVYPTWLCQFSEVHGNTEHSFASHQQDNTQLHNVEHTAEGIV